MSDTKQPEIPQPSYFIATNTVKHGETVSIAYIPYRDPSIVPKKEDNCDTK